jgi:hypothetical protein
VILIQITLAGCSMALEEDVLQAKRLRPSAELAVRRGDVVINPVAASEGTDHWEAGSRRRDGAIEPRRNPGRA